MRSPTRRLASAALITVILGALGVPAPIVSAAAPARSIALATTSEAGLPASSPGGDGAPDGGLVPSIQYQDAMAHADDQIAFDPGGRVTVGFAPRAGDSWQVDGGRSRPLPAGTASGTELRDRAVHGGPSAVGPVDPSASAAASADAGAASVDHAIGDPSAAISARTASFALPASTPAPAPDAAVGLRREVFGFLPYWELNASSTTLKYDVLSTIAYFSIGADSSGNLVTTSGGTPTTQWNGWTSSKMTGIINTAHANGTRVVLTVASFAWTTSQATSQATLLGSATARANLAQQITSVVSSRGADGVNLDFEPIVSGYSDEFTALVRLIRTDFDAIAPGYQITFDSTGYIGNYPLADATAPGGADAVFIMGYDYRSTNSNPVGSISPLTGPVYDLTDTVNAYLAKIPASKVILGVPYYGRAWSTDTNALHATNISSTTNGASVTVIYDVAADYYAQYGRLWDSVEQAPWTAYQKQTCTTSCVTTWRELYVDDAASLRLRYDLVNRTGLRGAGIWALGYDGTRPELYQALADRFLQDTTPPLAGIRVMAPSVADEGFAISWTAYDESSIAGYDVQVSIDGGAWTAWRSGTTATSDVYLGATGHGYAFRVRATDSHGNVSAWDVTSTTATPVALAAGGFGQVTASSLTMRATPTTSAASLGTLPSGSVVAVLAGPVQADGYTWWQVTGPLSEWSPVATIEDGFWIASGDGTSTFLQARSAPNGTSVSAVLRGYAISGTRGVRTVLPNDPLPTTVTITWTNAVALTDLTLNVFAESGTRVDSRALTGLAAGAQAITWDGRVSGAVLPAGRYLVQLVGHAGGRTVSAPSAVPVTGDELARFGITVDTSQGATYVALAPTRLLDSRVGNGLSGAFTPSVPRSFQVTGRGGVPANATAVTGNLTVTNATRAGYVGLTPTLDANPATSTINFPAGDTRANGVTVALGPGGTLSAVYKGSGTVALIFDVTGYYR